MSSLAIASWLATATVALLAQSFRSRAFAIFRGLLLTIYTLISLAVLPLLQGGISDWRLPQSIPQQCLYGVLLYLHAAVYLDPLLLIRPRLRRWGYRVLVSYPALYFTAAMLMSWPWAVASALGWPLWVPALPFVLCLGGVVQSLTTRTSEPTISVGCVPTTSALQRLPLGQLNASPDNPAVATKASALRLVQITDPHLGPFMSVARLSGICERAVAQDPDLIVLTGDYLTMESQADPSALTTALSPLKGLPGRVLACLGNHDHEALAIVKGALEANQIQLLVDDSTQRDTRAGRVQILGFDFHFRNRKERTAAVLQEHPRQDDTLRLVLLHDPGAFRHVPDGEADLVLSGHTHGGQVGLYSLGLAWTFVQAVSNIPDHSLWGMGTNRLYVHRGTGHYGYPLRLGVPAEEGVLSVVHHR